MGLIGVFRVFARSDGLPPGIADRIGLAPWLLIGSSVLAAGALVLIPRKQQ